MGALQRLPLPFGGGLDKATGNASVEPASMSALQNVALVEGRTELRAGLPLACNFGWGTDVVGIFPVRASGVAGVCVYDSATREVKLFIVDATGTTATEIGLLWTLDASATLPPVLTGADVYDKLFIAHNEAYAYRQPTQVYDPAASTLTTLQLDLDRSGTPEDVAFQGVKRWLAYLIGWGYGTHSDPDRAETLRISLPGDPLTFVPEHYFLVGSRGEPITAVAKSGTILAIRKPGDSYKLTGFGQQTFGVEPVDPVAGCAGPSLDVEVDGRDYFWSATGPRMASGDVSTDLALPLDITGDPVDILDAGTGFGYFDRVAREVVFAFQSPAGSTVGYVLHLRDGTPRWSRRDFATPLRCAGVIFTGGSTGLVTTATPLLDSVTPTLPGYSGLGDDSPSLTVDWHFAGALSGTEHLEIWVRSAYDGLWYRAADTATPALGTLTFVVPHFLSVFDVAIRLTVGGVGQVGYTNANPLLWPAPARDTATTAGDLTSVAPGGWSRTSLTMLARALVQAGAGLYGTHPELTYETSLSRDLGATWESVTDSTPGVWPAVAHPNSDAGTAFLYRVRLIGPSVTTGYHVTLAAVTLEPAPPIGPYHDVGATPGGTWELHHCHFAAYGADGGDVEIRARHVTPDQAYSPTTTLVAPTLDADLEVPLPHNGTDDTEVSVRTKLVTLGVTDYSEWIASTST